MAMNNPLRHKQIEGDTAKIKHDSSKTETQLGEMLPGRSAQRDRSDASASLEVLCPVSVQWRNGTIGAPHLSASITRNRCGNLQSHSRIKPPPLAP